MATGTVPAILPPPPPAPADSRERELIIQRQLGRTSLHVRVVDLGGSLAVWAIGVLLFFLVTALIDHLFGLGRGGRVIALVLFGAGTAYFLAIQVVPLLVRTINPTYAARTIEEATPALKNSLINFLLLRQDRSGIREIIYQAVERQAASDIADVPVEATVDRTHLLRAGYVLCGVMAVFAAYKILSPKDPFQTVARVLAPWADIARPSRVQISDVQPGNTEVFYGQSVKVSAAIGGLRSSDSVKLLYSTPADGQIVDRPVEMIAEVGGRYECTLPPAAGGGRQPTDSAARGSKANVEKVLYTGASGGLQQDVTYRIVAGDAESLKKYRLNVITAPTIIVERLEYAFPPYTKKPLESVPQQGDIKALEGTKVTIHAVANQPIKSAWLEFDPSADGAAPESVPLVAEGTQAHGTITLQLKPGRQTPWHATYQVRYYNERQDKSRQPILHKIDVIRDLPPEVQILQPQKLRVEVPQDGEQLIEVRAVDPDFGLSVVRIEGSVGGKAAVNADLLEDAKQPPQASVLYALRPREHKLAVGDELKYVAVAEDNRTGPTTGKPEPNVTRSAEYTLVVVAPQQNDPAQGNPNQQQKPSDPQNKQGKAAGAPPKPDAKGADKKQTPPGADQKSNQQPRQPDQKDQQEKKTDGGQGQPEKAGGQKSKQEQGDKQQKGEQGQEKGQNQPGQEKGQEKGQEQGQQQEGNQQGQAQQGKTPEGGQSGSQKDQPQPGQSQEGSSGKSSDGDSQKQSNPSGGSQGENGSQRNAGGQASGERQQPSGQGDQQADAANQPGGAGGSKSKTAHDGDAIEKVFKELQKQKEGEQSLGQQSKTGEGQQQPGENQEKAGGQGQQPQDQGQQGQGEKSTGQPKSDPAGNPAGKQGEKSGSEAGAKPQASGKSGAQGQNTPDAGQPGGDDQKPDPMGKGQPAKEKEKAGDARDRLPDDKQGQNPSEQPAGGNKGGAPQGPSKTDRGEKSEKTKGEQRDPGAAQNSDEGAGTPGQDKSGSGEGTRENKDHPKTQQPDSSKSEQGSPSSPSNSKKQSDSKGGQEGDESGGGKQGGGQSSKQKGQDSAGSQSAADQGAGKAEQTGAGETGDKAGTQQQAAGKTGKSGDQKGEGSAARADEHGDKASDSGQPSKDGSKTGAQQGQKSNPNQQGTKGGGDPTLGGGGDGQRPPNNPEAAKAAEVADAANLEYARKATDMVLKHLKDEEHNPDPELLDKLGWTREDLAEFLRRWDALQKTAQETPSGKREMDEALRSLGLRDPANRKRAGGTASDSQRDLRDGGNRSAPPPKYRDLFDAFRKGAARSRE